MRTKSTTQMASMVTRILRKRTLRRSENCLQVQDLARVTISISFCRILWTNCTPNSKRRPLKNCDSKRQNTSGYKMTLTYWRIKLKSKSQPPSRNRIQPVKMLRSRDQFRRKFRIRLIPRACNYVLTSRLPNRMLNLLLIPYKLKLLLSLLL